MSAAPALVARFAGSPAPIEVLPPPHASSSTTALDVPDRQVLVRMFGVAQDYWMHLFLVHVTGAVWVTLDPHGEMPVLDLAGKEFAVVLRGSISDDRSFPNIENKDIQPQSVLHGLLI